MITADAECGTDHVEHGAGLPAAGFADVLRHKDVALTLLAMFATPTMVHSTQDADVTNNSKNEQPVSGESFSSGV